MEIKYFAIIIALVLLFGCTSIPGAPEPASNLKAQAVDNGIKITWTSSPSNDVSGYNVYRSQSSGTVGEKINPAIITSNSYTDTEVQDGTKYYYVVRAISLNGDEEKNEDQVSATADLMPSTPMSISLTEPINGETLPTHFTMQFTVTNVVGTADCNAYVDSSAVPIGTVEQNVLQKVPLILSDGGHKIYVECTDQKQTIKTNEINVEVEEDPVSLKINDGSSHTDTQQVTLHVHAPSASKCRYSNDGQSWSSWENYVTTKTWELTYGDGEKTVYVSCENAQGTELGQDSDTITLTTTPSPTVYLSINNGEKQTGTTTVTLYTYAQHATECRYSNDGSIFTQWQKYTAKQWYSLNPGDGMKTVYVQCKNDNGEVATSTTTIELKQKTSGVPKDLEIQINHGESHTSSRSVVLTMNAKNADSCRYQNDGGSWSGWYDYQLKKDWTLAPGEGTKTVYYQCENGEGLSSITYATITLDSVKPTLSVSTPVNGQTYSEETINVVFTVTDEGASTITCTYYCNGKANDAGHIDSGQPITRTLVSTSSGVENCDAPGAGSQFSTRVTCIDNAGNSVDSGTITFTWTQWVGPLI